MPGAFSSSREQIWADPRKQSFATVALTLGRPCASFPDHRRRWRITGDASKNFPPEAEAGLHEDRTDSPFSWRFQHRASDLKSLCFPVQYISPSLHMPFFSFFLFSSVFFVFRPLLCITESTVNTNVFQWNTFYNFRYGWLTNILKHLNV